MSAHLSHHIIIIYSSICGPQQTLTLMGRKHSSFYSTARTMIGFKYILLELHHHGTVGYIWEKLSKFMMFSRQSFISSTYKKIIIRISACMENMSASSNYISLRSLRQQSKYGQILLILVDTHTHTHTHAHTFTHSYTHTFILIDTFTHHIVTHAHTLTYILSLSLSFMHTHTHTHTHTHSRQKTCIKNKILRTLTVWQICANQGKTNNLPCSIRTLGFVPGNMLPSKS